MTRTTVVTLAIGALAGAAFPAAAAASLGGSIASVESDRVQMKSALVRITRSDTYTVQETLTPTGTTIRQYYTANGVVFGVAWQGPQPDLRQLFGTYFDQYVRAVQTTRKTHKARGQVAIDDGTIVVRVSGHLRAFSGVAYAPGLMPSGINSDVIR